MDGIFNVLRFNWLYLKIAKVQLLEEILGKSRNNPIYQFDRHTEIEDWLREQWAGLFRELINRRTQQKQLSSLSDRISELSSINSSLQRYMESIVSTVSPDEAEKIISTEKERLDREKTYREFHNIRVVGDLSEHFDIEQTVVEKMFRKASSIENLARMIGSESSELFADNVINHWRENPTIVDGINKARSLLEKPPLEFESKE